VWNPNHQTNATTTRAVDGQLYLAGYNMMLDVLDTVD
jgi:hypothetical protein